MNIAAHLRKILYIVVVLSVFVTSFWGNPPAAHAASQGADQLPEILKNKLEANGFLSNQDSEFVHVETVLAPPYAILGYAILSRSHRPETFEPEIAIGFFDGTWSVRVREIDKTAFNEWLDQVPDSVLSDQVKLLHAYQEPSDLEGLVTYTGHYLPWQNGVSHTVTQYPGGSTSHQNGTMTSGAWDWYMPVGTELWASQSGKVAKRVDGNSTGIFSWNSGLKSWCTPFATTPNYIVVNNDGGGASLYLHLQKGSIPSKLTIGAPVKRGELVGKSGNVGYVCSGSNPSSPPDRATAGAHLHFQVQLQTTASSYMTQSGTVSFSDPGWTSSQSNPVSKNVRCPDNGGVILYVGTNFSCNNNSDQSYFRQRTGTGFWNIDASFDNRTSSIRVQPNWSVMLYELPNRGGGKMCYNYSTSDFGSKRFYKPSIAFWSLPPYVKGNVSSIEVFSSKNCGAVVFSWSVPPYIASLDLNPGGWQDDTFDNIAYAGNWSLNTPAGSHNNTLHTSSFIGDMASFQFEGDSFDLIYTADSNQGQMDVFIDGNYVDTVDQGSGALVMQDVWSSPSLTSGPHEVQLVHVSGSAVNLDALAVGPNMPSNLMVNGTTPHSVTINWQDMSNDENGFAIYRWDYDYENVMWDFFYYDEVPAGTTSYTDIKLDCGQDYYYEVSAFNGSGESARAAWVVGTTDNCPPVGNDDFGAATPITQNPYLAAYETSGATCVQEDPTIPDCNLDAPDNSIWYSFTPPADGQLYVDTTDSSYDTVLALWTGSRDNLTPAACNDDSGDSYQSALNVDLTANTTYYLEVGRFYNYLVTNLDTQGSKANLQNRDLESLSIDLLDLSVEFVAGPPNDKVGQALVISQSMFSDAKDTMGATRASDDPALTVCDRDPGMASVWYKFTAPSTGQVYIDTIGSDYDTMLALWTGSPGNLSLIDCNDDTWSTLQSELNADLSSGVTYYIEVAQFWDFLTGGLSTQSLEKPAASGDITALAGGTLNFNLQFIAGPANDELSSAEMINNLPYDATLSTLGATLALNDPSISDCSLAPGLASVWYEYTPSADEAVHIDTFGSDYDTYLAIWAGLPGNLSLIACNDDDDFNSDVFQSSLTARLLAGQTYFIETAQWNGYDSFLTSIAEPEKALEVGAQSGGTLVLHSEIDVDAPIVSYTALDGSSLTDSATVDFTVKFSESVTGVDTVGPTFNNFILTTSGVSGAYVSAVSGSDNLYTVTVNTGTGNGRIRLDLVDDDSIRDVADIPLGGFGMGNGDFIGAAEYTITKTNGADTAGVFRPVNGLLCLKNKNDTGFADAALNYGLPGDYPVVGDWDGNGTVTIGIYRDGYFYLKNANTLGFAEVVFPFGQAGDQPIAGDWNGDSVDTIGVLDPSNGHFFLRNSNTEGPSEMDFYLGNPGDVGIAGDWDGDGIDSTGVFRPSNGLLYLKNKNETGFADAALNYGLPGDRPVTGDWDNDGIDTIGIYRNGSFYLRNENTNGFAQLIFGLGNPGDMPIAGNWDGLP